MSTVIAEGFCSSDFFSACGFCDPKDFKSISNSGSTIAFSVREVWVVAKHLR